MVWLKDQHLPLAQHIRHILDLAELNVEMRAHLFGLSRSRREDAGLVALYINMSIYIKRST